MGVYSKAFLENHLLTFQRSFSGGGFDISEAVKIGETFQSMPETELEDNHLTWWKRLLLGALAGSLFGALEIWFYEFSLNRLIAAILSGASFFAVIGLLAAKFAKDRSKIIALGGLAGFVAGIAYWLVARPALSLLLSVAIGLVGGIVYVWAESRPSY